MFGFIFEKLLLIGFIVVFIIGFDCFFCVVEGFVWVVCKVGEYFCDIKFCVCEEMGLEFDDVDWCKFDLW